MIKISCYKTTCETLAKTFCQLAEKCYYNANNTCVITNNDSSSEDLDAALWTYSKKHFIPHATDKDTHQDRQPIYISSLLKHDNNPEVLLFINLSKEKLLTVLQDQEKYSNIKKVLIVFDNLQELGFVEIDNFIKKSSMKHYNIDFFERLNNGSWLEKPI